MDISMYDRPKIKVQSKYKMDGNINISNEYNNFLCRFIRICVLHTIICVTPKTKDKLDSVGLGTDFFRDSKSPGADP